MMKSPLLVSKSGSSPNVMPSASHKGLSFRWASRHIGVICVLPATILLFAITVVPFGYLIYNSLTSYNLQRAYLGKHFIGFDNYVKMFQDGLFWDALRVTFSLAAMIVVVQLIFGMLLALLFQRQFIGTRFLRSLLLLPLIMTPVVVGLTWRMLYNSDLGMINYVLGTLGLPTPIWLATTRWAPVSILITDTWASVPFVTLMFVAGLQAVPMEPKEAALVDGASKVRVFFDIILPQLRPLILLAFIFRATDALRMFDLIYVMTSGGPANATQTLNMYAFKVGFQFLDIGYGSALAAALMVICMIVSFVAVRFAGFDLEGTRA
ncbi:MAG: carbohydrate ABC transporter permease [Thermomicrobiales bacterium]